MLMYYSKNVSIDYIYDAENGVTLTNIGSFTQADGTMIFPAHYKLNNGREGDGSFALPLLDSLSSKYSEQMAYVPMGSFELFPISVPAASIELTPLSTKLADGFFLDRVSGTELSDSDKDAFAEEFSEKTSGFSPAELENIINSAACLNLQASNAPAERIAEDFPHRLYGCKGNNSALGNFRLDVSETMTCSYSFRAHADEAVSELLSKLFAQTKQLLSKNHEIHRELARFVFEHESVSGEEFSREFESLSKWERKAACSV